MKKQEWNEGLNNIDPDILERYLKQKQALKEKKNSFAFLKYAAVAACMCLVVCGIVFLPMMFKGEGDEPIGDILGVGDSETTGGGEGTSSGEGESNTEASIPPIPVWDDAKYTAGYIKKLLKCGPPADAVATNAYTTVCVSNDKYLYIDPIPENELVGIYKLSTQFEPLNEQELEEKLNDILPRLESSLGIDIPDYTIAFDDIGDGERYRVAIDQDGYLIFANQTNDQTRVSLNSFSARNGEVFLDGERIEVDFTKEDREIIASLESIKNKLFDIFGVEFSDVKISRDYSEYSEHSLDRLYVYYYNKDSSVLDLMSEYIVIGFDNFENYSGDNVSDRVLSDVGVDYISPRASQTVEIETELRRITIEEAEALLYNGCVFGGHVCPLCMAMQDRITFDGYSYVELVYRYAYDENYYPEKAIPFYAFYKKIGMSKNGNTIYAKTYVCAIELSGYDSYIKSQEKDHKSGW